MKRLGAMGTRRDFLKQSALAATLLAGGGVAPLAATKVPTTSGLALPWNRRALRWGQTNITENDPEKYNIDWWRAHWKRTEVQGVIINAGGIVAYYPSKFPLHRRAQLVGERGLFGEAWPPAPAEGGGWVAGRGSHRAHEEVYRAP